VRQPGWFTRGSGSASRSGPVSSSGPDVVRGIPRVAARSPATQETKRGDAFLVQGDAAGVQRLAQGCIPLTFFTCFRPRRGGSGFPTRCCEEPKGDALLAECGRPEKVSAKVLSEGPRVGTEGKARVAKAWPCWNPWRSRVRHCSSTTDSTNTTSLSQQAGGLELPEGLDRASPGHGHPAPHHDVKHLDPSPTRSPRGLRCSDCAFSRL
jgi:hypothetical protein